MRKILILTQPLHLNYGGVLQAYALQSKLREMGHEVVTDRQHNPMRHDKSLDFKYRKHRLLSTIGRFFRGKKPYLSPYYPSLTRYERMMMLGESIFEFVDRYIDTVELFDEDGKIREEEVANYDAFVVGSDQVWRRRYSKVPIENYFLSFVSSPKVKRLAYAASFGIDNVSEYNTNTIEMCSKSLALFDGVSVRESSAVELCQSAFGVEAQHLLDPTMLYTKAHYSSLALEEPIRRNIVTSYILDPNILKDQAVEAVASEFGLEINKLRPKRDYPTIYVEDAKSLSVERWLAGFRDAEFVVTDSFHGMVFSILYEKQFLVIVNGDRGGARFESLAKEFGLERCLVSLDGSKRIERDNIYPRINYRMIRDRLNELRAESLKFLREALA